MSKKDTNTKLDERINNLATSLEFSTEEKERFYSSLLINKSSKKVALVLNDKLNLYESTKNLPNSIDLEEVISEELQKADEAGDVYIVDKSSLFMSSVLSEVPSDIQSIVDICAAPGGKSIISSMLFKNLKSLISNEANYSRGTRLRANLNRCKVKAEVTNFESKELREKYFNYADLVIVDAPCSGQSMFAKGKENISAFSKLNIRKFADTQKGILKAAAEIVKVDGYIAYMTCTFSKEENEAVLEWFFKKMNRESTRFEGIEVKDLEKYRSKFTDTPCYRLYPHYEEGAGGFTSLIKRVQ